jgi:hypothetical protein
VLRWYRSARLLFTGIVVTSELPRERDTLLLRLMGAGPCMREALVELAALPADAREHAIAVPVLSRCYVDIPTDPANRTIEEEEFMTDTQEFYEEWKRERVAEGRAQGLVEGRVEGRAEGAAGAFAKSLAVVYEIHFGAMPPELKVAIEATEDEATLLGWLRLAETGSAEAFAATVLGSRGG